jgi:hypothetical protein
MNSEELCKEVCFQRLASEYVHCSLKKYKFVSEFDANYDYVQNTSFVLVAMNK